MKKTVFCILGSFLVSFAFAQNQGITGIYTYPSQAQVVATGNPEGKASPSKKEVKAKDKEAKKALKQQQKEEAKQKKADEKARQKLLKKQKKDRYTGWVYIPDTKFSITNGNVKIYMNGRTGSFGLYAIPEDLKPVALISTVDAYSSTFFSVKIGRKEYRLNRENGVKSEARRTPYGAQMSYTIPKQAQIVVDFSFLPSIATSSRVDMLRVTVYTINLGKHTQSFAVKGVFDTLLGENTLSHFSTAARRKINSETQFLSMADDLWIRSENEETSIQFLLDGKGISKPGYVTLSNKDQLSQPNWVPVVHEEKSFNSVLTYNNSALAINWKTAYLDPLKTDVVTFYISVGTDTEEPAGKDFLVALEEGRTALAAKMPEFAPRTSVPPEPLQVGDDALETSYYANMPVVPGNQNVPIDEVIKPTDSEPDTAAANEGLYIPSEDSYKEDTGLPITGAASAHEPDIKTVVMDPKLNPEYIQSIIDRVQELENDSTVTDRSEIEMLNSELDEIFTKLRKLE